MVKKMETPMKMDDLGGKTHYFRKNPGIASFMESFGVSDGDRFLGAAHSLYVALPGKFGK